MAKATLDRLTDDLSAGHTHRALQRLGSLVAAHPADLDLRRRLGAVYLSVGNLAQAGRWQYLHEDADRAAVAAFERAYPTAPVRLRALRWPGTADQAPTWYARQRLHDLAAVATGFRRRGGRSGSAVRVAGLAAAAAVLIAFALVGAVTVVQWLW